MEEAAKLKRRRRPKEGAVKRGATKGAGRKRKDHKKGWPTKEGGHERRVPVSIPQGATKGAEKPRDGARNWIENGGSLQKPSNEGPNRSFDSSNRLAGPENLSPNMQPSKTRFEFGRFRN